MLQLCDFQDFACLLGVDAEADPNSLETVAVNSMFARPLGPFWSEQVDESSSRVYFFNSASGESSWAHPHEAVCKELLEEIRTWSVEDSIEVLLARSEALLRKAHRTAAEAISPWTAYDAPQGPEEAPESGDGTQFFFNSATGESRWVDPRQALEYELRLRHHILSECIAAQVQMIMRSEDDSSDEEDKRDVSMQEVVKTLWTSLGALPLPLGGQAAMAPKSAPQGTASLVRPSTLPLGDDTARSAMSYLTARSTISGEVTSRS